MLLSRIAKLINPASICKCTAFGRSYQRMTFQLANLMQKFATAKGTIGQDDELVMLA